MEINQNQTLSEKIYKKGVRYLYSKFIFNLVFLEKSKTVKKHF